MLVVVSFPGVGQAMLLQCSLDEAQSQFQCEAACPAGVGTYEMAGMPEGRSDFLSLVHVGCESGHHRH
jgi:hypothetical protein